MTWKTAPKRIKAWSNSRLKVFETCPYQAMLKFLEKIPELERPLPPGKTEHANERGSRIHKHAEDYVIGKESLMLPEMRHFEKEFAKLRLMHATDQSSVACEGGWAFDAGWKPVPYDPDEYPDWKAFFDTIWGRVIIDCLVWLSPTEAIAIDYKTGKRFGNEIDHGKQMQLYQLAAFMRYPELETVHVELWYLDQNEISPKVTYSRPQGLKFFTGINNRALKMTEATEFLPTPSQHRCKFCPYKTGENKWVIGTGDCTANPIEKV